MALILWHNTIDEKEKGQGVENLTAHEVKF